MEGINPFMNTVKLDQITPGANGVTIVGAITVGSAGTTSLQTFNRPANVTAYTAGDVIGDTIIFSLLTDVGRNYVVDRVTMKIETGGALAGLSTFKLYMFGVTPNSPLTDNVPFVLANNDRDNLIGVLQLTTPSVLNVNSFGQTEMSLTTVPLNAETGFYGVLVTDTGFTPLSSMNFAIRALATKK